MSAEIFVVMEVSQACVDVTSTRGPRSRFPMPSVGLPTRWSGYTPFSPP